MTVVRRSIRSNPHRDSMSTWQFIVDLLTKGKSSAAHEELLSVIGIASSIIADKAPESCPILVTCEGPRTRIYCVYDDEAIEDSGSEEAALGFDPLKGDWEVSLPCQSSDVNWVQSALKKKSNRITARDVASGISESQDSTSAGIQPLQFDPERF